MMGINSKNLLLAFFSLIPLILAITVNAQIVSPTIRIDPVEGPVGTSVSVRGSNFLLNSEVRVIWEDQVLGTGKADSGGNFWISVRVPEVPGGYYKIIAIDEVKNNAYSTFRVTPKITKFSISRGAPGSMVSISGNGFSANFQVEVRLVDPFSETQNLGVKRIQANENGVIQVEFEIPNVPPGDYRIYALDSKTGLKTEFFKFTVEPPKTTPVQTTPTPVQNQTTQTDKTTETTPVKTTPKTPVTYTPRKTPGFEVLVALGGIATALLISRRVR
ncbi:MAG: PGF-CTERM sorting domain-containing protein [Archaeoglobaceae archaeon]|nr:PGF-CTERM sorting domain-containing protein [Archaeoglobaceae archaeon]MDW8127878.1 hypothetical protein [Archaeoglobaceae archaeon]